VRLFLAVELDAGARARCSALLDQLRHSLGDTASALKWTATDNIHITLHFLGEVDRTRADRLIAALGSSLPQRAFRAETTHLGAFPHGGPPKVVWLGIGSGGEELRAVHRALAPIVTGSGLDIEDREFSPHLTLGRVRDRDRHQTRGLRSQLTAFQTAPIAWQIDHVTLFQSDLSGAAPRYRSLLTLPLSF